MNKTSFFLGIPIIIIGISTTALAQASISLKAKVNIVTPISITTATDMDFGNVTVNSSGGTVVLTPAGTRSSTGGVSLPANAGTVTAASFNVTGAANFTYSITLPNGNYTLQKQGGNGNIIMEIGTFTSSPSGAGILIAGAQTFYVGATLNVQGSQAPGIYTKSSGFAVRVDYN